MSERYIQLEIEFKDYLEPLTRKSVGRPRSIAEYIEEEGILSHIKPPPPEFPNFSELTLKRVAEWKVSKRNERVILICMARISSDFHDLGFYDSALETIDEAWDCENRGSCLMRNMRKASLEILRAKCYLQLNQFDEAIASCKQAKTYGAPEVTALERLIHEKMAMREQLA